jgi:hypothetical protein
MQQLVAWIAWIATPNRTESLARRTPNDAIDRFRAGTGFVDQSGRVKARNVGDEQSALWKIDLVRASEVTVQIDGQGNLESGVIGPEGESARATEKIYDCRPRHNT